MHESVIFLIPFMIGIIATVVMYLRMPTGSVIGLIPHALYLGFKVYVVALIPNLLLHRYMKGCNQDLIIPGGAFSSIMALVFVLKTQQMKK